ncbi:MAG: Stp1/IreP family PP2C-type Ser/Thr phosphatase [Parasporobacterium sp.]|nr:Stp1/IreP family PP2C-type Ser/Thr phosphatase [Parasporobacterium sp.]
MEAYMMTDVGMKRSSNQDYVFKTTDPIGALPNLFLLADGMGGYKGGEVASKDTVEKMCDYIENADSSSIVEILTGAAKAANSAIIKKASDSEILKNMGTTIVAATIEGDNMTVLNVGDSRLYIVDDDIRQITHDHSYVAEMVSAGAITKEQAKNHSDRNKITRAVGAESRLKPDIFEVALKKGDKVLLCSDGLYNMVDDDIIKSVLNSEKTVPDAAKKLVELANKNGGDDNVSVVIINI